MMMQHGQDVMEYQAFQELWEAIEKEINQEKALLKKEDGEDMPHQQQLLKFRSRKFSAMGHPHPFC